MAATMSTPNSGVTFTPCRMVWKSHCDNSEFHSLMLCDHEWYIFSPDALAVPIPINFASCHIFSNDSENNNSVQHRQNYNRNVNIYIVSNGQWAFKTKIL